MANAKFDPVPQGAIRGCFGGPGQPAKVFAGGHKVQMNKGPHELFRFQLPLIQLVHALDILRREGVFEAEVKNGICYLKATHFTSIRWEDSEVFPTLIRRRAVSKSVWEARKREAVGFLAGLYFYESILVEKLAMERQIQKGEISRPSPGRPA